MQHSECGDEGQRATEGERCSHTHTAVLIDLENHNSRQRQRRKADLQAAMEVEIVGTQGIEFIFLAGVIMTRMGDSHHRQKAKGDNGSAKGRQEMERGPGDHG